MFGLAKLAYEQTKEEKQEGRASALTAGGVLGLIGAANVFKKPDMDKTLGLQRFYHGTSVEDADSIRQQGLLGRHANREGSITHRVNVAQESGEDALKNKVYMTPHEWYARENYSFAHGRPEVVGIALPRMDLEKGRIKSVPNPELLGLSEDDYVRKELQDFIDLNRRSGIPESTIQRDLPRQEKRLRGIHNRLSYPHTMTVEGDIAPRFIGGSRHYRPQNLAGFLEYAAHYPGILGRELAPAAASVGLGGLGLAAIAKGIQMQHKQNNTGPEGPAAE